HPPAVVRVLGEVDGAHRPLAEAPLDLPAAVDQRRGEPGHGAQAYRRILPPTPAPVDPHRPYGHPLGPSRGSMPLSLTQVRARLEGVLGTNKALFSLINTRLILRTGVDLNDVGPSDIFNEQKVAKVISALK